ncbi:hypothetical protein HOR40_gp27 [Pectobacterium phage PP74]|uniref:Uncharacterized protein n=1 Tax=Pectobacterium phage PP74 TaxID=1916101 RepID=A0A1J0MEP2_9CAUD|nr:hypothetical protein HOR40_gp27 [Pectobacterium phage PP74]APD19639.1 hypothetical protein PP74_27 [Pectobacterium phage PP74]
MSKLLARFDALLGHLNAEENGMALELRADLKKHIESAADDRLWRECLETGSVDNWSWFSESLSDGGYYGEDDE